MWLNQLKIAVIEKDMEQLDALLEEIPTLHEPKEIEEALFLLKEAAKIFETLKQETAESMQQMKKNINFLNSTQANTTSKFDITS
jgi:hypothetical protein